MPKAVSLFLIRDGTQFAAECPLLAQSGHAASALQMSAFDPKRTFTPSSEQVDPIR